MNPSDDSVQTFVVRCIHCSEAFDSILTEYEVGRLHGGEQIEVMTTCLHCSEDMMHTIDFANEVYRVRSRARKG